MNASANLPTVTVEIPPNEEAFDATICGTRFEATLAFHVDDTNVYVVIRDNDGQHLVIDKSFIISPMGPIHEAVPHSANADRNYRRLNFCIEDGLKNENGETVGRTWTRGEVMHTFANHCILIRLPAYDAACFFSGYTFCAPNSPQIGWKRS